MDLRTTISSIFSKNTSNEEILETIDLYKVNKASIEETMCLSGKKEAKDHEGQNEGLLSALSVIYNQYLEKEISRWRPDEKEIQVAEAEIRKYESDIIKAEGDKEVKELEMEAINRKYETKKKRLDLVLEQIKSHSPEISNTNWILVIISSIAGIGVSAYLGIIYSNIAIGIFFGNKEMFNDPHIVTQLLMGNGIFSGDFAHLTVSQTIVCVMFPFVFFSAGVLLHNVWSGKFSDDPKKSKYAGIGILVMTLLVDALLAYKTHSFQNAIREMQEMPLESAFLSSGFWIVLACGFIVFLIWSGILHSIILMVYGSNDSMRLKNQLNQVLTDIEVLDTQHIKDVTNNKISKGHYHTEITSKQKQIDLLRASLHDEKKINVSYSGELRLILDAFYNGWRKYLAFMNIDGMLAQETYIAFKYENFEKEKINTFLQNKTLN